MDPVFLNQNVGNQICIDWDICFRDFLRVAIPSTLVLIDEVKKHIELEITAWYQESAKGNVHVGLRFNKDISVLDAFMIRAFMADDSKRLRLDMARYMKTGSLHEMNRCFQNKIEIRQGQATLLDAGPWIRLQLHVIPDITATDARGLICKLQKEMEDQTHLKKEVRDNEKARA